MFPGNSSPVPSGKEASGGFVSMTLLRDRRSAKGENFGRNLAQRTALGIDPHLCFDEIRCTSVRQCEHIFTIIYAAAVLPLGSRLWKVSTALASTTVMDRRISL